ncbi:MAG: hypothetical protein QT10_C0007G0008 [archaeon GW2011_AR19]|nr:MAG: hypothetical protein QT10_C0007G0008 [archaeon GW2011_AR19]
MIKMNTKNLLVFFFALASILLVANNFVSAGASELVTINDVKIDDVFASGNEVAVVAGETITVKVFFTALQSASDVKLKLELEGAKVSEEAVTAPFTIEREKKYSKTLTLTIPYELQDEVSDELTLDIKVWNGDFRTEDNKISLNVQRPSYNAAIMSIDSAQSVEAGKVLPVDVVLKNTGYNRLDDVFVTVKIGALGLERSSYFGDLVAIESKNNDDTVTKRFLIELPSNAKAGAYTLEVKASNNDFSVSQSKQIAVKNEFSSSAVVADIKKSASVGSETEFELVIANPTDKLRVFRIVTESNGDLTTGSSAQLVSVPAGQTKTIAVTAKPHSKGDYTFDVSIFAGEELVDSVKLGVLAEGRSANSGSIVALTIILVIIFLVLLGALIALMKKKPEQSEEFGESYY